MRCPALQGFHRIWHCLWYRCWGLELEQCSSGLPTSLCERSTASVSCTDTCLGLPAALQDTLVGAALCCVSQPRISGFYEPVHEGLQESDIDLCAAPCCFSLSGRQEWGPQVSRQPCRAARKAFCTAACCLSPVMKSCPASPTVRPHGCAGSAAGQPALPIREDHV